MTMADVQHATIFISRWGMDASGVSVWYDDDDILWKCFGRTPEITTEEKMAKQLYEFLASEGIKGAYRLILARGITRVTFPYVAGKVDQ